MKNLGKLALVLSIFLMVGCSKDMDSRLPGTWDFVMVTSFSGASTEQKGSMTFFVSVRTNGDFHRPAQFQQAEGGGCEVIEELSTIFSYQHDFIAVEVLHQPCNYLKDVPDQRWTDFCNLGYHNIIHVKG